MQTVFLQPQELRSRWHIHIESVRRLIRAGKLPAVKFGGRLRVRLEDVETYEKNHRAYSASSL